MLKARLPKVQDFIKEKANKIDICKNIEKYNDEVQEMAQYIYESLWRFNLYDSQIIYVLNEALTPFSYKK